MLFAIINLSFLVSLYKKQVALKILFSLNCDLYILYRLINTVVPLLRDNPSD